VQLPYIQTTIKEFVLLQNKWKSILDAFLATPSLDTSILENVKLSVGTNVINHLLGRKLQGWRIVRQRAASEIYDQQDSNQTPQLTLVLVSSAAVTVNLEVF
jgi:hypothetical protein